LIENQVRRNHFQAINVFVGGGSEVNQSKIMNEGSGSDAGISRTDLSDLVEQNCFFFDSLISLQYFSNFRGGIECRQLTFSSVEPTQCFNFLAVETIGTREFRKSLAFSGGLLPKLSIMKFVLINWCHTKQYKNVFARLTTRALLNESKRAIYILPRLKRSLRFVRNEVTVLHSIGDKFYTNEL
jgi:hypothetical protein